MKNNAIFIHCALLERWDIILKNFIDKIIISGLYENVEIIYINCIGNKNNFKTLEYLNKEKIKILLNGIELNTFEISTQELLYDFSKKNHNFSVLTNIRFAILQMLIAK